MNEASNPLRRTALYLAVVQFLFFTTWIVYVTYLGELLERIGLGRDLLIWFILLDQLVFAVSDTVMGYAADRFERVLGRIGPLIAGVNVVSCLAFALLPLTLELGVGGVAQTVFTLLIVVWIATSSVLRAPPIGLLMKHAARPRAPRLVALTLLGLALGGAVSPYLGLWLKGVDPVVPFMLTGATLLLVTLGMSRMEALSRGQSDTAPDERAMPPFQPRNVVRLLLASLLLGFGFQIHFFLNTKPQFLAYIGAAELVWVLPLFWVGFKLLVFPGAAAARRFGPVETLVVAALVGGLATLGASFADSLGVLIAAQMLAGGAWGVVFMAGISAALGLGTRGREGLVLGLWFTMLSVATLIRGGLVAGGVQVSPAGAGVLDWLPPLLWLAGGLVLIDLALRARRLKTMFMEA